MLSKFKINYFIILVISLVLLSCKDKKVPDTKLTAREIYDKNVNNTVTVVTPNGLGSGFFIDKNLIITNYHVVEGENNEEVMLNNSDKKIKVIGYLSIDKVNDLILLKIDYSNNSYLDIEKNIPSPGDKVFAIGSPIGLNKTISEGIVSGIRSLENNKLIQITTPISHGSSGCPIINEKGKLIAVAVSGIDGASNIGFCIPSNYVNSLIDFKESYPKEISTLNPTKSKLINNDNSSEKKTVNEEENIPKTSTSNDRGKNSEINKRFLGKHLLSVVGIDYPSNNFGTATIKLNNGKYLIDAFQKNEKGEFIKLKGEIIILNLKKFIFKGNLYVYSFAYNSGLGRALLEACESNENLIFEATNYNDNYYWREQKRSSENGCWNHTADIDIFFKTDPKYKEINYP
jgi:hypothetical protein